MQLNEQLDIENGAGLARVTCGWKKPELSLDFVRSYWRDAHSPAISRRHGLYEYRHYPLDPIRPDWLPLIGDIDLAGRPDQQLMWLSDVRYRDEAGMEKFAASPGPAEKSKLLADIELIVDQSTTYKVIGRNGWTFVDKSGDPAPQGPVSQPTFALFFRQRSSEAPFRALIELLAERWAVAEGVIRVRQALFDVPDMEAERRGGYPIKTHPSNLQYQAWVDLVVSNEDVLPALLAAAGDLNLASHIGAVHAYPVPAVYTFNYGGRPTLSGLRGYPAVEAIRRLGALHQQDPGLLRWMYGDVVQDGPLA